jgi:uncharacterized membrane protein YeiB
MTVLVQVLFCLLALAIGVPAVYLWAALCSRLTLFRRLLLHLLVLTVCVIGSCLWALRAAPGPHAESVFKKQATLK